MKKLGIIALACITGILVTGCGCEKKEKPEENKPPVVENNGIIFPEKTSDGLKYTNASAVYDNGVSTITFTVTNTSDKEAKVENITVTVYDGKKNVIKKLDSYVGRTLKKNETSNVTTQITYNLRDAKDISYTISK